MQCPECAKAFAKYWQGYDESLRRPDGEYGAHVFHLPTAHGREAFLEVVGGACIYEAEKDGEPNICVLVEPPSWDKVFDQLKANQK